MNARQLEPRRLAAVDVRIRSLYLLTFSIYVNYLLGCVAGAWDAFEEVLVFDVNANEDETFGSPQQPLQRSPAP